MLAVARKYSNENITLAEMNGEQLSCPDDQFDYVVLSHVIAVTDDPEKLLGEVHRVLKPGGKFFILNHFTPDNSLRHIDKAFNRISAFFHFKSLFYSHSLKMIEKFRLEKEIRLGRLSYYKILIYSKP
jgi:phosphatidylethanolamine/phosphatidyl-N-methylethanolamine N-methyltransferase